MFRLLQIRRLSAACVLLPSFSEEHSTLTTPYVPKSEQDFSPKKLEGWQITLRGPAVRKNVASKRYPSMLYLDTTF
jgi:hypothetical protein